MVIVRSTFEVNQKLATQKHGNGADNLFNNFLRMLNRIMEEIETSLSVQRIYQYCVCVHLLHNMSVIVGCAVYVHAGNQFCNMASNIPTKHCPLSSKCYSR